MGSATQTPVKTSAEKPGREDWGVEHCVLEGVSWDTYEALLRDLNDRPIFLTYDNGTLEIMAPSGRHGMGTSLISSLLFLYTVELDIPMLSVGMVTVKKKKVKKGLEPDSCFYIKNEPKVAHKEDLDFSVDPPPDLAIEMEVSRRVLDRIGIYAALRVPEVWLDDGKNLRVLHLQASGEYAQKERSLNFPRLDLKKFESFLRMRPAQSEHEVVKAFRAWLRKRAS